MSQNRHTSTTQAECICPNKIGNRRQRYFCISAASGNIELDYFCEFEASEADIVVEAGGDAKRCRH